jgi:dolichol-phosphate mannosyltransferase
MKLSVVVPIFNESSTVKVLLDRLESEMAKITDDFEIILVDDGSSDDSFDQIYKRAQKNDYLKWIQFSRNFGHQAAISAGLSKASGDAIVTMDGDLQDPPELISALVQEWSKGYEVVYARRSRRRGESWAKLASAYLFYRLLKKITPFDMPEDVGDFRLIDKKVSEQLFRMPEPKQFLRGQIAWMGFSSTYVYFERAERFAGKSKYSFSKILELAFNGIWGFSKLPIVLLWVLAIIMFGTASIFLVWGWRMGFPTEFSKIAPLLLFTAMFILIGSALTGEYIYRIFKGIRNRPAYIIKETNI